MIRCSRSHGGIVSNSCLVVGIWSVPPGSTWTPRPIYPSSDLFPIDSSSSPLIPRTRTSWISSLNTVTGTAPPILLPLSQLLKKPHPFSPNGIRPGTGTTGLCETRDICLGKQTPPTTPLVYIFTSRFPLYTHPQPQLQHSPHAPHTTAATFPRGR